MTINRVACSDTTTRSTPLLVVGLCLTVVGIALMAASPWGGAAILVVAIAFMLMSLSGRSVQRPRRSGQVNRAS